MTLRVRSFLLLMLSLCCFSACAAEDDEALESAYFEDAYERVNDPGKADQPCNGVSVPDRNGFNKRIALTFDDGPNPATTPRIMEILRRKNIPATFLMNGMRLSTQAARNVLADIQRDPLFTVGSHTQNHLNLATVSAAKARSEIQQTATLLDAAGVPRKWLRFPFGSSTCETMSMAQNEFGYRVLGWHIDSADWCFQSGHGSCPKATFKYVDDALRNDMIGWVKKQVRATNGGIVLFHDVHSNTANNLEAIIDALIAEGYTFVRVDDANAFPKLNQATQSPTAFIGSACTENAQCGFTANGIAGTCHETGDFCTITCNGTCPDKAGSAPTFCIQDPTTTTPRGICVSQSSALNHQCQDLPMTSVETVARYIGSSSAAPSMKSACVPMH